jgi:hypothetical protein
MDTAAFRGQIEVQAQSGTLDIARGHTGDFEDANRFFRVRAISAADGYWLLTEREPA